MFSFEAIAIAMSPSVVILSEGIPSSIFLFPIIATQANFVQPVYIVLEKQHVSISKPQRPKSRKEASMQIQITHVIEKRLQPNNYQYLCHYNQKESFKR